MALSIKVVLPFTVRPATVLLHKLRRNWPRYTHTRLYCCVSVVFPCKRRGRAQLDAYLDQVLSICTSDECQIGFLLCFPSMLGQTDDINFADHLYIQTLFFYLILVLDFQQGYLTTQPQVSVHHKFVLRLVQR